MFEQDIFLAQKGDEESLQKILVKYRTIIQKNNSKFFLKGGDKDDLIQEGFIGLIKAIKFYDKSKNASFSTFANLCIRRQIITAVKNSNLEKHNFINNSINTKSEDFIEDIFCYNNPSFEFLSPEDIVLGKELIANLMSYMSVNLSSFEKCVFFYLCKQYSYIEIANLLDLSPKKIDNTLQRVKKKIFKYLDSYR